MYRYKICPVEIRRVKSHKPEQLYNYSSFGIPHTHKYIHTHTHTHTYTMLEQHHQAQATVSVGVCVSVHDKHIY